MRVEGPLYGVPASWASKRWLDSFGYEDEGEPVTKLTLGHASSNLDRWVLVQTETSSRSGPTHDLRDDETWGPAWFTAYWLIVLTWPEHLAGPLLAQYPAKVGPYAEEWAADSQRWRTAPWSLADTAVVGRVTTFAGVWAGYARSSDGSIVRAAGRGLSPDGLVLQPTDGARYGFDPNDLGPESSQISRDLAIGDGALYAGEVTSDHYTVLRVTQGPS